MPSSSSFKMAVFCVVGCIFAFLWLARLTFTLLFFVPACICLTNETTTETCGNDVFSQDLKDEINMAGTLVEAGNSFLIILLIFCWHKFNVTNFFLAAPRLAVFWFWIGLFSLQTISSFNTDITSGQWIILGVSIFLESAALILLSLALKFVDQSTVKAWINRTVSNKHWAGYLYFLYVLTLWMYLLRNLALLFYDMAILTKKIDRHASRKQIDNIMKITDIATRSSFVQFYYAALFRNPQLSTVCEENTQPRDQLFPIAADESADSAQTLIAWEPHIK